ncbi:hypothetical protein [Castellaniella sp.]|uniref:hypothetical protein n=1 Tax=Castellaniella sp. TaxID=1955812 RepID=UPI003566AEB3
MKVTLDLESLLRNKDITDAEYEKLRRLAASSTDALAFSLFIGFGVVTVALAALALVPTALSAILIGAVVLLAGLILNPSRPTQWRLLANICTLIGALLAAGGIVALGEGNRVSLLVATAGCAGVAALTRSSLMAVLATLLLGGSICVDTTQPHVSYAFTIENPVYIILLLSLAAAGLHHAAIRLPERYARPAAAAARTALFLVNFAFWVGSLWEDDPSRHGQGLFQYLASPYLSAPVFAIAWALALLATGVWAWRRNHRWALNAVAVFAALNLYTQWFERLDASAGSVLLAGLLALGITVGLHHVNTVMRQRGPGNT